MASKGIRNLVHNRGDLANEWLRIPTGMLRDAIRED
jgi:hypothetical protein